MHSWSYGSETCRFIRAVHCWFTLSRYFVLMKQIFHLFVSLSLYSPCHRSIQLPRMHLEIQVALNFLISFLYNKLPRRRVNNFGEELEQALKVKFESHWYPEKPFKGSAFRCLKTTPPLDPVFEIAARESGMDLSDIQENLPQELSIWIDPGEVSYRMSEKGPVKILYSESDTIDDMDSDRDVIRTFNPEAQCFKPVELMTTHLAGLSMNMNVNSNVSPTGNSYGLKHSSPLNSLSLSPGSHFRSSVNSSSSSNGSSSGSSVGSNCSPTLGQLATYKSSPSSIPLGSYGPKSQHNTTMTTAAFAQTKFGSTKLKTSGKRPQRMSPTEFGCYIKQKALIQQQQQQQHQQQQPQQSNSAPFQSQIPGFMSNGSISPQNVRSISPESPLDGLNGFTSILTFMSSPGNACNPQTPSPPTGSSYGFSPFGSAFDSISISLDELLGSWKCCSSLRFRLLLNYYYWTLKLYHWRRKQEKEQNCLTHKLHKRMSEKVILVTLVVLKSGLTFGQSCLVRSLVSDVSDQMSVWLQYFSHWAPKVMFHTIAEFFRDYHSF